MQCRPFASQVFFKCFFFHPFISIQCLFGPRPKHVVNSEQRGFEQENEVTCGQEHWLQPALGCWV